MAVPDIIYVEIRHPFGNEFTEIVGFENKGNSEDIEYIRKDALLEWIQEARAIPHENAIPRDLAFQEIVNKVNKM